MKTLQTLQDTLQRQYKDIIKTLQSDYKDNTVTLNTQHYLILSTTVCQLSPYDAVSVFTYITMQSTSMSLLALQCIVQVCL